jgi:prepilin-type N-terminal cleavage/methylation domain-containing protein
MKTEIGIKRNSVRNIAGGFTLVELLVVIAIIALLLSVMMPSLQKARTIAQMAICSSNMKQLFVVQFTHASGNDGKFPYHGANWASYHHIESAKRNNFIYRVDIYDAYKAYIGNSSIFVCPITAKFAPPDGKTLGFYRDAKWRQPREIWGWWYGGWAAKFNTVDGDVGDVVRQSPYNFFAGWKPKGLEVKVYDPLILEREPDKIAFVVNKADKWATSQIDLGQLNIFVSHEIYKLNNDIVDRGHGGKPNGPRVTDISRIERASNPIAFGDGAVLKVPTPKFKLRAWYKESPTNLVELYW